MPAAALRFVRRCNRASGSIRMSAPPDIEALAAPDVEKIGGRSSEPVSDLILQGRSEISF